MIGGCLFRIEGVEGRRGNSRFVKRGECAAAVQEGSNEVLEKEYFNVD
jgi:hypothetical protein